MERMSVSERSELWDRVGSGRRDVGAWINRSPDVSVWRSGPGISLVRQPRCPAWRLRTHHQPVPVTEVPPPSSGTHKCRYVRSYDRGMESLTARLWSEQNQHETDRFRLFSAVREGVPGETALYPGSFVDIAASAVYPSVTYVDTDKRTPRFFADIEGIAEILASMGGDGDHSVGFIHADYRHNLGIDHESFDLLVSLYAGFVSEHCTQYLKVGGTLLVTSSHGDAAMASIDPRYTLSGVVLSRSGNYRVRTEHLGSYLVPKQAVEITQDMLHELGRGIGYTKSPFAYLFTRVK